MPQKKFELVFERQRQKASPATTSSSQQQLGWNEVPGAKGLKEAIGKIARCCDDNVIQDDDYDTILGLDPQSSQAPTNSDKTNGGKSKN
jgi:hypothetical protein